jgi:hypothetical protein
VGVLGVSACVGEGPSTPWPSPTLTPQASSTAPRSVTAAPTGTVEDQIRAVYRHYWTTALPAAAAAPRAERRAILEPVMVEPALSSELALLLSIDREGQELFGHAVPVSQVVQQRGGAAVLRGCLDSHQMGRIEADTGRYVYRGVPREAVLMTFKLGEDGRWRVSGTYLPEDPRC